MKRFSSLMSKAGDVVQQANQDYQRMRQEAKQQYEQQQHDVRTYQTQQYAQQQSYYPGQPPIQQPHYSAAYQPANAPTSTAWSPPASTFDSVSGAQAGRIPRKDLPATAAQYQPGYPVPGQIAAAPTLTYLPRPEDFQQQTQPVQYQTQQQSQYPLQHQQHNFLGSSSTPIPPASAPPPPPAAHDDGFEAPLGPPPGPPPGMSSAPPASSEPLGPPPGYQNPSAGPHSPVPIQQPTYAVHEGAAPTPFPQAQGYPPPLLPSLETPVDDPLAQPVYATPSQTPAPQQHAGPPPSAPHVAPGLMHGYPAHLQSGGHMFASPITPVTAGGAYQWPSQPVAQPVAVELPATSRLEQEGPFQLDAPLGNLSLETPNDKSKTVPDPGKPRIKRGGTPEPATIHESGVTPLAECTTDLVTYEMDWLQNATAPDFLVCGRCYVDDIYDTPFKDSFTKTRFTDKRPRRCLFGTRRVRQKLWPDAVSSGSLEPFTSYMTKRAALPDCPEDKAKQGESWYTVEQIPGVTLCRGFYEDQIAHTPFASYFKLEEKTGPCSCVSSIWYFKRLLETHTKTQNWTAIIEQMNKRETAPACPQQAIVQANDRAWYTSTRGPQNLTLCVACYYDYFHPTADEEDHFQQMAPSETNVRCIMAYTNLHVPAKQAVLRSDTKVFWDALQAVDQQPFCNPEGTTGAEWYTLIDEPPEFAICGGCYAGIVGSAGGKRFFKPHRTLTRHDAWICCLSPNHIRGPAYLAKYTECLAKGSAVPLAEFVGMYGDVPLCNASQKSADQGFYGWQDWAMCQECYVTCARGTALEHSFVFKGDTGPTGRICDLYSPRMRKAYSEACEKNDVEGLLALGRNRHQVWEKTVAVRDKILQQHQESGGTPDPEQLSRIQALEKEWREVE